MIMEMDALGLAICEQTVRLVDLGMRHILSCHLLLCDVRTVKAVARSSKHMVHQVVTLSCHAHKALNTSDVLVMETLTKQFPVSSKRISRRSFK